MQSFSMQGKQAPKFKKMLLMFFLPVLKFFLVYILILHFLTNLNSIFVTHTTYIIPQILLLAKFQLICYQVYDSLFLSFFSHTNLSMGFLFSQYFSPPPFDSIKFNRNTQYILFYAPACSTSYFQHAFYFLPTGLLLHPISM